MGVGAVCAGAAFEEAHDVDSGIVLGDEEGPGDIFGGVRQADSRDTVEQFDMGLHGRDEHRYSLVSMAADAFSRQDSVGDLPGMK